MEKIIQSVCIYCASSARVEAVYTEAAGQLGTLLGKRNLNVINGAGSIGLMRVVSDATLKAGGTVTGVIPRFMVKNGWGHSELTKLIEVETMHERKQTMADLSDAAIALPGGYGTLEELLEIITWKQLGLYHNPIIIMNTNNYYDPLFEMLRRAIQEKFIREEYIHLFHVAQTPQEVITMLYDNQLDH